MNEVAPALKPAAAPAPRPPAPKRSAVRLNELAKVIGAKRYLEIGVSGGRTFMDVDLPYKVAVDPVFKFDWQSRQGEREMYYPIPSDDWFLKHAKGEMFDLILIDGLHTFEQCYRDFCNTLSIAHTRTVWVIDDTVPTDAYSSWPHQGQAVKFRREAAAAEGKDTTRGMGAWHGDVFKFVFALHDFYPAMSYLTSRDGNGQTILWWEPRPSFKPLYNDLGTITRMSYFDMLNHPEIMNYGTDQEAQAQIKAAQAG